MNQAYYKFSLCTDIHTCGLFLYYKIQYKYIVQSETLAVLTLSHNLLVLRVYLLALAQQLTFI